VYGTAEAYTGDVGPVKGEICSDRDYEKKEAGAEEEDRCQVCALGGFGHGDAERKKGRVLSTSQLRTSESDVKYLP